MRNFPLLGLELVLLSLSQRGLGLGRPATGLYDLLGRMCLLGSAVCYTHFSLAIFLNFYNRYFRYDTELDFLLIRAVYRRRRHQVASDFLTCEYPRIRSSSLVQLSGGTA